MAKELGFQGLIMNSLNGVGDRDFTTETMQWASMLMGHISRISEDLIIYSTAEFGFLKLSDAYSTGSSLMPQKVELTSFIRAHKLGLAKCAQKNSDSLELLRGKSGRVMGQMMGLMVTTKVYPSTHIPPKPLTISPGSPKHLQQRSPRIRRTSPRLHQNHQRLNPNINRRNQHPGHQPRQNARSLNPRYARNRYVSHPLHPQNPDTTNAN